MNKAAAALLLAISSPAAAQGVGVPPEQAAGQAMMQCVAHSTGQGSVVAENADLLAENGLVYSATPPPFLESARQTPYGTASFARSPSTDGQIWAVGYDQGACLVVALGTETQPIETRLVELFAIPGAWQQQAAAKAEVGERKLQYGWLLRPNFNLTALVSIRELPEPAKGMVMITINRTAVEQ